MDEIKSLEHMLEIQKVFDYVERNMKLELHDTGLELVAKASITFAVNYKIDQSPPMPDPEKTREHLAKFLTDGIYGPAFKALTWYNYEARKLMGRSLREQEQLDYMERLTATLAPFRTDQRIPEDGICRLEKDIEMLLLRCDHLGTELSRYKHLHPDTPPSTYSIPTEGNKK